MLEEQLLNGWTSAKRGERFYRLSAEAEVSYEFNGGRIGHPSNYASIRIHARPADQLTLDSSAIYPLSVSPSYAERLLAAVGQAVVDELFAAAWTPYRGCALEVVEVGWHEVSSSEVALYRAARGALEQLRTAFRWEPLPNGHRK